jgi:hypothetical protein
MEGNHPLNLYKPNQMTNTATARPTAAQIQKNQARADRKAAALARRNDDYRNDAGFASMYAN